MVSSVTELLGQALPLLAIGAGQTLAISLLAILFANLCAPLIDHYVVAANIKRRLARNV